MAEVLIAAGNQRCRGVRAVVLAVAALLAVYAAVVVGASLQKGLSFDEAEHLAVGYDIWRNADFRMEGANGDFVKRWATLPYLVSKPNLPGPERRSWREARPYRLGFQFFFQSGNAPEWLLLQGRLMMVLVGLATGLLIFFCARETFGNLGGVLALALFVSSRNMLAFGGLVSTTMPECFALLGATWCVWHLLHEVTWKWLAASLAFSALLILAKPSGIIIVPITAVLVVIRLIEGTPLVWSLGAQKIVPARFAQAGIFAALALLHIFIGWAALWANYGFRYESSPYPDDEQIGAWTQTVKDSISPLGAQSLQWAQQAQFLPEGFLAGIEWLLHQDDRRNSFMDGEWTIGGWISYFPYAIWAKSSPALILLALIAVGWWGRQWWRGLWREPPTQSGAAPDFYALAPYVTLILVYLAAAMAQDLNIGHRHILPIYPAVYILAGGTAALAWRAGGRWLRGLIAAAVVFSAAESVVIYPHYLAYFSPLVGGPAKGYQRLVDSSLDWGMNLPALKNWLDEHNPDGREPVYLAYFGTDQPEYYGIRAYRLPGYPEWRRTRPFGVGPGLYAISATLYESLYVMPFGPWNWNYEQAYQKLLKEMTAFENSTRDQALREELIRGKPPDYWNNVYYAFDQLRFGRLCAWLRQNREPDDMAGYSILIWRLSSDDLHAALLGPPPERGPTVWRWAAPQMEDAGDTDAP